MTEAIIYESRADLLFDYCLSFYSGEEVVCNAQTI